MAQLEETAGLLELEATAGGKSEPPEEQLAGECRKPPLSAIQMTTKDRVLKPLLDQSSTMELESLVGAWSALQPCESAVPTQLADTEAVPSRVQLYRLDSRRAEACHRSR